LQTGQLFQKDDAAPQLDMERFVNRDQTAICQIKLDDALVCGVRFDSHKPVAHIYAAQAQGLRW
jgi:hypothetical protein